MRLSFNAEAPTQAPILFQDSGFPGETFEISNSNGELAWSYQGGLSQYSKDSTLTEVEPGLLFSENGNLFDLRGPVPMIDNIRLVKAESPPAAFPDRFLCHLRAYFPLSPVLLAGARPDL